jgi:long-chain acyl-CoA synthetase
MNISNISSLEKEALGFENSSYSYQDLIQMSQKCAGKLQQMKIKAKDRVILFLPNCPEFIFWYLGIAQIGAIVVPLNPLFTQKEVQTILADCDASLLITNCERKDKTIPHVPTLFIEECDYTVPFYRSFSAKREDELAILYTSGTTGFPKGATLTHGNVRFVAESMIRYCHTTSNDRLLLAVPISHCFGQNLILHHAFQSEASIILLSSFNPKKIIDIVEKEKITMIFGVPTMYRLILESSPKKERFKSVRYCHSGASFLPEEVALSWFKQFGIPIHQGYGLTESSPLACYNDFPQSNFTCVGKPINCVKIKIVDDQGMEVATDELGEIIIQGPNVMKGYWNRPQDTAFAIRNNWLYSGDIGRCDSSGNIYIVDRKKDLINVAGTKVCPAEVESILEQHAAIKEVAVFGVPDLIFGERLYATIVLKKNQTVSDIELVQFCKKSLASFKIPTKFERRKSLPRNSSGKILRRILREQSPFQTTHHENQ